MQPKQESSRHKCSVGSGLSACPFSGHVRLACSSGPDGWSSVPFPVPVPPHLQRAAAPYIGRVGARCTVELLWTLLFYISGRVRPACGRSLHVRFSEWHWYAHMKCNRNGSSVSVAKWGACWNTCSRWQRYVTSSGSFWKARLVRSSGPLSAGELGRGRAGTVGLDSPVPGRWGQFVDINFLQSVRVGGGNKGEREWTGREWV